MSLLTIVQDAAARVALTQPAAVASSATTIDIQFRQLAQQEGDELSRRFSWQALQVDYTFTSVASETQTGVMPSDFDRFVDDTFWNRSRRRPVLGPHSPQSWQTLKATAIPAVTDVFRLVGDSLLILPAPAAGQTYAFTYITNKWCQSSGGTTQAAWNADTDTARIPERLLTLGVVWRFLASRGFDATLSKAVYDEQVALAIGRDGGRRSYNFGADYEWRPRIGVPEGDWTI